MNNGNETLGLRILSIYPSHKNSNVSINTEIKIEFSADINPSSLIKNIVVFEDYNKVYQNIDSLKDYSQFNVVKGSISYSNRILTYRPDSPFNIDTCYIVILNNNISDITGNKMLKKYISCFYTESEASYPRCEIVSPSYGAILNAFPEFVWKNQYSESYTFQISKSNTFELLLYNNIIKGNKITETISHKPLIEIKDGMYHIRIKSENGLWSNIHQIYIKAVTDAVIAEEDISDLMQLDEFIEDLKEPIEVLEYFPSDGKVNVNLNTNTIYIKLKGQIEPSRIDINSSYIYGESVDEEHEEYVHEIVDGKWSIVYDSNLDVTYVIFVPDNLDDKEELEYIETLKSGRLIQHIGGTDNSEDK